MIVLLLLTFSLSLDVTIIANYAANTTKGNSLVDAVNKSQGYTSTDYFPFVFNIFVIEGSLTESDFQSERASFTDLYPHLVTFYISPNVTIINDTIPSYSFANHDWIENITINCKISITLLLFCFGIPVSS